MRKILSLKKRTDFLKISKDSYRSARTGFLVLGRERSSVCRECNPELDSRTCRMGYTVTKKIGNAVVRNRIRRRLREAVRDIVSIHGTSSFDYVIIAKKSAIDRDFAKIKQDLRRAMADIYSQYKDEQDEKDFYDEVFGKKGKIKNEPCSKIQNQAPNIADEMAEGVSFSPLAIDMDEL